MTYNYPLQKGGIFHISSDKANLQGLDVGVYDSVDSNYRIQLEVYNAKNKIIGCASFFAKTNYFGEWTISTINKYSYKCILNKLFIPLNNQVVSF